MKILTINTTGKSEPKQILRKNLADELGIHVRDLRPVFFHKQVATIFTRNKSIIINLGKIKLIVTKDKVFIFNFERSWVEKTFIPEFIDRIKDWKTQDICFEFWVLDFILVYKMKFLQTSYAKLKKKGQRLLTLLQKSFDDANLEKLLNFRKELLNLETNIKENKEAVIEILEDDGAMEDLYFSDKKDNDYEEVESILEAFLEQVEEIVNSIDELQENLDDTQGIISLKMNNRRNAIIRLDLVVSILTTILTIFTVITGVYGMNLRNNMEDSYEAFLWITGGMWGLGLCFFLLTYWQLKRKKVL